ncbi:hypothetical protein [Vagococcus fluvialis]|uniref:Uncharacterized protein n=1 Tax=Vagococcus fluvialis TaxID=2738 RepID=A0A7X6DAZ2_9ENTE|nr:hypothetical protein [Vagococcus fluvialis]NKC69045.1 hypothetical protein [Vagococcus fluvialis]
MSENTYVGLYNFSLDDNFFLSEYFDEIIEKKNDDKRNFVVVVANNELEAKRKVFKEVIGEYTKDNQMEVADFILNGYWDENGTSIFNSEKYNKDLDSIYDKFIEGNNYQAIFDIEHDKRKSYFEEINQLDYVLLEEIFFLNNKNDIYLTTEFKNIN